MKFTQFIEFQYFTSKIMHLTVLAIFLTLSNKVEKCLWYRLPFVRTQVFINIIQMSWSCSMLFKSTIALFIWKVGVHRSNGSCSGRHKSILMHYGLWADFLKNVIQRRCMALNAIKLMYVIHNIIHIMYVQAYKSMFRTKKWYK